MKIDEAGNTSPSPLTGETLVSSEMSKDADRREQKKSHSHSRSFGSSSCRKCTKTRFKTGTDDLKTSKDKQGAEGVQVLKPVNNYLTKDMHFHTYRLKDISKEHTGIFRAKKPDELNEGLLRSIPLLWNRRSRYPICRFYIIVRQLVIAMEFAKGLPCDVFNILSKIQLKPP